MVLSKRFDCTHEDLDAVVVELSKEIEDGWYITKIETHPMTFGVGVRINDPEFSIELCRRRN